MEGTEKRENVEWGGYKVIRDESEWYLLNRLNKLFY